MPKVVGTVVGTLLLLPGVAVALVHYLAGSSDTMKVVILAIAAALLVVGWALLGWSKGNIASLGSGRVEGERAIIPAARRRCVRDGPQGGAIRIWEPSPAGVRRGLIPLSGGNSVLGGGSPDNVVVFTLPSRNQSEAWADSECSP